MSGTGLWPVENRLIFKGELMSYQTILFDQEAGVATITFNRPDRLNALNHEMLSEFRDALDRVRLDPEIRVLLLTGAGNNPTMFRLLARVANTLTEGTHVTGSPARAAFNPADMFPKSAPPGAQ